MGAAPGRRPAEAGGGIRAGEAEDCRILECQVLFLGAEEWPREYTMDPETTIASGRMEWWSLRVLERGAGASAVMPKPNHGGYKGSGSKRLGLSESLYRHIGAR